MEYVGTVKNGVVVLENGDKLPEGMRVSVQPVDQIETDSGIWKRLLDLAQDCAVDGPTDLADRHDHYAHGKPLE